MSTGPARAYYRIDSGLALVVLLLVAIFSLAALPPTDPDLWWHLANGRLLLQAGWPRVDAYSFSAAGHVWVMHEWLADLVMYQLSRVGGLPLLVAGFAALITAAAGCLYLLLRSTGLPSSAAAVLTLIGALAGSTTWGARPQVFNLVLFGALVGFLLRYRRGRLGAWWVIPLLWVWANLHSAFVAGVILIGLFLLGEGWAALREEGLRRRWIELAGALLAGLAVSLINPYGVQTLLFPLGTLTSPLIQNNIQEWASPDFHSMAGRLLELLLFVILLGLATGRVRATPTEWCWALGFLFLALASQRHVPLFVLAAAPLIGRCAHAALQAVPAPWPRTRTVSARHAAVVARPWSPQPSRVLPAVNALLIIVVAAGMIAYRALPNLTPAGEAGAVAGAFPASGTQALEALGRPLRIFNEYAYGGYLIYQLFPTGSRVFIDGRVEVYGSQLFAQYLSVAYATTEWRSVIERYDPDAIVLPSGHPIVSALESEGAWTVLHRDRVATVFLASGRAVR